MYNPKMTGWDHLFLACIRGIRSGHWSERRALVGQHARQLRLLLRMGECLAGFRGLLPGPTSPVATHAHVPALKHYVARPLCHEAARDDRRRRACESSRKHAVACGHQYIVCSSLLAWKPHLAVYCGALSQRPCTQSEADKAKPPLTTSDKHMDRATRNLTPMRLWSEVLDVLAYVLLVAKVSVAYLCICATTAHLHVHADRTPHMPFCSTFSTPAMAKC